MFVVFEIAEFATVETILISIPESAGVLIFGVVLVVTALLIRKVMGRTETKETDEKAAK